MKIALVLSSHTDLNFVSLYILVGVYGCSPKFDQLPFDRSASANYMTLSVRTRIFKIMFLPLK